MVGVVSLKPISDISDDSIQKLKPKVILTNSSSSSYNAETTALKIPDQFCFLFGVYCEGFNRSKYTYEIKVEVTKLNPF